MLSLKSTRNDLIKNFKETRTQTEYLAKSLNIEDYIIQTSDFASPVKWMLGHVTWFFDNFILLKMKDDFKPVNEHYYHIFNSYYLSSGIPHSRPSRGTLSRPTVEEVYNYRQIINNQIAELVNIVDDNLFPELVSLMNLGINHEQQHQELFMTDLKYNFSVNPFNPVYRNTKPFLSKGNVPDLEFVPFDGGVVEIGYQGENFFFDNEQPVHKVYLQDFKLANRPITNKEYLDFINDKGYDQHKYWLSDGWNHIKDENWEHPLYWVNKDGEWYNYTLYGMKKVDPDEPVTHISYYEADAYAKWAGKRLPTEYEWEHAVRNSYYPLEYGPFSDDETLHPISIRQDELDNSKVRLYQILGNVWEWTASHYQPYPGYMQLADGIGEYNGKFMNNQYVLRGGSIATPRNHIRIEYRNFFYPHERWQFTGLRLADLL